jgi:hypothetical protein
VRALARGRALAELGAMRRPSALLTFPLVLLTACLAEAPDELDLAEQALGVDADADGYQVGDDCNDTNALIHPRRAELANGLDDNCSGIVDEPMLRYRTVRPLETSLFSRVAPFEIRVTNAAARTHLETMGSIDYQLTVQALSSASAPAVVMARTSMTLTAGVTWWRFPPLLPGLPALPFPHTLVVDPVALPLGLAPRAVYRFQIRLFTNAGVALGPTSDWFYAMSGGTISDPSGPLQGGRIDLVLHALDQLGDDLDGLVGKHGTTDPDGSRYTGSSLAPLHASYHVGDDLLWCDWFYHWAGAMATDGLDGNLAANVVVDGGTTFWQATMNPNNVPNAFRDPDDDGCGTELVDLNADGQLGVIASGCQNYTAAEVSLDADDRSFYRNDPANLYYDAVQSLPSDQKPGNYQAMDSHAGMFLAFDPAGDGGIGTVWSIEGNVGNRVRVMSRPADSTVLNGFGKLRVSMFQ